MNAQLCVGRKIIPLSVLVMLGWLLSCRPAFNSGAIGDESVKEGQKPAPIIKPQLEQCTLEIGQQVLKPIHTASPMYREERVGDRRIRVSKDQVVCIRASDNQQLWSAKTPNGQHLHSLTQDGEIAYFLAYEVDSDGHFSKYETPPRVRRLDLKIGRWWPDLPVETPKELTCQAVLAVLAKDDYVIVLSALVKMGGTQRELPVSDYQVACFRQGKTTSTWSKIFPAAGERPKPGVYLWAPRKPDYAASILHHLAWLGDTLLVCTEAMQPLLCLNPDTGTKIWELDRPWEFERGFIGPSVWSHYLGRFRLNQLFGESSKEIERARQDFDKRFSCALVGGPADISISPGDKPRFFLAVSKGPANHLSGYISDCILYEFDEQGKPLSLLKLPQMVSGSNFQVLKDGIVWKCQNQSFFKIVPSPDNRRFGMGPGGPDLLTRMPWFRQVTAKHPNAWLVADRAGDPLTFSNTHAFCVPSGGYITHGDKSIYHFPLTALDLQTAVEHSVLLNVPFKGELPPPKTNYRGAPGDDGRHVIHASGPYVLAVTGLRFDSNTIEITLGMENWSAVLSFDLGEAKLLGADSAQPSGPDPIKTWLANLGNVNKPDADGSTPLGNAAGLEDSRYIKALLAAGANPRAATKGGWTALTMAATYGTPETVQLLIDAGADVNARDTELAYTILMWATYGRRQSKKKVQALLKAGADLKATAPDGRNMLLIAASAGDVPTVEVFLQAGLDVSYRSKDGETALMLAARGDNGNSGANLLCVLLKAGADVNARDKKGKTVLMYAADGFCSLDGLRLLLESGADPQLKDNQGQTAPDLARASNTFGAKERAELLEGFKRR